MKILIALGLTIFAGLSTGIGSGLAFFAKRTNVKALSAALGFSAGVMIYVSFVEIFPKAFESLSNAFTTEQAYFYTTLAFFVGIGVIAFIDYIIPNEQNPHEFHEGVETEQSKKKNLMRLGVFTALAIAIHNFPEGLATFIATVAEPELGISIAIAIAIHNIPEGIAVAIPIYHATGSKKKAVIWTFLSGLAEPVGAVIGFFLLSTLFNELTFGFLFASVAGIMVYISLDELLPAAEKYGEHHISIIGVISGMMIMALSLILL